MKSLIALAALTFSAQVFAAPEALTSCKVDMSAIAEDKPATMDLKVFKDDARDEGMKLYASVTNTIGSQSASEELVVTEYEGGVREGLSGAISTDVEVSTVEAFIVHAMMWEEEPSLAAISSLPFDLKSVRSAKVYQIGPMTEMGTLAIVEAKDANGAVLGRFMGGFLVVSCQ